MRKVIHVYPNPSNVYGHSTSSAVCDCDPKVEHLEGGLLCVKHKQFGVRPPMVHSLKTHPKPFAELRSGAKTFEFRKFDRDYRVGDQLLLMEFNPDTQRYTVEIEKRKITHILSGAYGCPEEYCVLSLMKERVWMEFDR